MESLSQIYFQITEHQNTSIQSNYLILAHNTSNKKKSSFISGKTKIQTTNFLFNLKLLTELFLKFIEKSQDTKGAKLINQLTN